MRNHLLLCAFLLVCGGLNAQTQLLGSPTTLVKNRGAFMSDSLLYIPKRSKTPADSGAIRYQISDSAIYVWTGSQWIKAGGGSGSVLVSDTATMLAPYIRAAGYGLTKSSQSLLIDSAAIATRARVQKGIDSLGAITVKLTGGQTIAGNKTFSNDITFNAGSYFRGSLLLYNPDVADGYNQLKSKSTSVNFRTIYFPNDSGTVILDKTLSSYIGSSFISGTTNYVPKFTGTSAIGNSIAYDNGTELLVNTTSDAGAYTLQNSGAFYNTGSAILAATSGSVGIGTTLTTGKLNFENTTAVVTDGIIFTAANVAGTNHGFRIGINRQARAEVASSIKFLAENYSSNDATYITFGTGASDAERMRITSAGELLINTTSDAGAYALQVSGAVYATNGAVFAAGSGNVGIGTASPGSKLTISVAGSSYMQIINTSTSNSLFVGNNAGDGFIETSGAYATIFQNNGAERMRIKSDGEVLIGTTSDAGVYPLQVSGNIYNTNDAHFSVTGGGVGIGIGSSPSKLWIYGGSLSTSSTGGSGFASRLTTGRTGTFDADRLTSFHNYFDSESIEIASGSSNTYVSGISVTGRGATNYSGSVRFITSSSERMRINPDGEVLIGSSTDQGAYQLQVTGSIYTSEGFTYSRPVSTISRLQIVNGAVTTRLESDAGNGQTNINAATNNALTISTNDTERMRITSTGRILAGTTSAFSGGLNEQRIQSYGTDDLAGFSALRVSANTGGSRFVLAKSRGATYTIVNNNDGLGIISFQGADGSTLYRSAEISGQVDGTPSAGSVPGRLVFETNMSERMRIKSDGEILIATTTDAGAYALQVAGETYQTNNMTMQGAAATTIGISIRGNARTNSEEFLLLQAGGSTEAWVWNRANGSLRFATNNTERLRAHADGGLRFIGQSAAPTAEAGTVYYDTDDNKLKVYNGTTWVDLH